MVWLSCLIAACRTIFVLAEQGKPAHFSHITSDCFVFSDSKIVTAYASRSVLFDSLLMVCQTGRLPLASFEAGIRSLNTALTDLELLQIMRRAQQEADDHGMIDYERFMTAETGPHGDVPSFVLRRSHRGSGDVVGWTTQPQLADVRIYSYVCASINTSLTGYPR